jgi:hypothetical protein
MTNHPNMEVFKLPAKDLWQHPNKLVLLDDIVKQQGFAGPTNLPRLSYLVLLTALTDHPVSMAVKAPSGAGKSYGFNKGKQFIPPKAYEQFEGMSEKALIYLDLDLKHKHLFIGEAAGLAEGNGRTLLRQLLSEGSVRYATVQSTSNGLEGSELPTLEGPTGVIVTTTAPVLHPEDASRMLQFTLTESPEQILAALLSQAMGRHKSEADIDLSNWHEMYDLMASFPKEVSIPFASDLASQMPRSHDRIKRDFKHILSLIEVHALLHRTHRDVDDEGRVIANQHDYEVVQELLDRPLAEGLEVSVPDGIKSVVEGVIEIQSTARTTITVSQAELASHLKRDRGVVSRNVKGAIAAGYLKDENPGQGKTAALSKGEVKLRCDKVLPSPEELFGDESRSEALETGCEPCSPETASLEDKPKESMSCSHAKNWKEAAPWE